METTRDPKAELGAAYDAWADIANELQNSTRWARWAGERPTPEIKRNQAHLYVLELSEGYARAMLQSAVQFVCEGICARETYREHFRDFWGERIEGQAWDAWREGFASRLAQQMAARARAAEQGAAYAAAEAELGRQHQVDFLAPMHAPAPAPVESDPLVSPATAAMFDAMHARMDSDAEQLGSPVPELPPLAELDDEAAERLRREVEPHLAGALAEIEASARATVRRLNEKERELLLSLRGPRERAELRALFARADAEGSGSALPPPPTAPPRHSGVLDAVSKAWRR